MIMDLFDVMLAKKLAGGSGAGIKYFKIEDQSEVNLWELEDGIYCGDGEISYNYNESTGEYIYGTQDKMFIGVVPVCFVVGTDSAGSKSINFLGASGTSTYDQCLLTIISFSPDSHDGELDQRQIVEYIQPNSKDFVDAGTVYDAIQNALIVDTEAVVE